MDDRFLEDLKSRIDLVELIGRYAEVKKSGRQFMCRSPFRNERTPSFSISPDKQVWYDFGASEGGDAIRFIEKIEQLSFQEAIVFLAERAGVSLPEKVDFQKQKAEKKVEKDLFSLHRAATDYFVKMLHAEPKALKYLHDRGFKPEILKAWEIGYAGDQKDGLTKYLLSQGFSETLIASSGVAFSREFGDKSIQDRFWGRIMIPIKEAKNGEIIAFSGRDILNRSGVGKYINSPESPLYHKSSTLFGLFESRKSIRDQDLVILVEGNFDVVTMHQFRFCNTIATCGTSLTPEHLQVIKRLTNRVLLAFDSDIAGKKATLRGVEMCLSVGLTPFILSFDGAKDCDEFLQKEGNAIILQNSVKNPENGLSFLLSRWRESLLSQGAEGRKKILDRFFPLLILCQRSSEIDYFLQQIADIFKSPITVIRSDFEAFRKNQKKPSALSKKLQPQESTPLPPLTLEECFLGILFQFWEKISDEPSLINEFEGFVSSEKKPFWEAVKSQVIPEDLRIKLCAWSMAYEKSFPMREDFSENFIKETLKGLIEKLKREKEKQERLSLARAFSAKNPL